MTAAAGVPVAPPRAAGPVQWPVPHHMRLIDNAPPAEPERALLTLLGGEKLLGTLVGIDFEAGRLDFQPERGPLRPLPFGAVRHLFLSRSVELEPIPLAVPPGTMERKPELRKRPCSVRLRDGHLLETDVVAALVRDAGLFLYVPNYANEVLRWFLPREAVLSYQVAGAAEVLQQRDDNAAQQPPAQRAARHGDPATPQAANVSEFYGTGAVETREELEQALERQRGGRRRELGELLLQHKLATPEQLQAAEAQLQAQPGDALGDVLVRQGVLGADALKQLLVSQLGVPSVQLARFAFDPNAVKALSPELARKYTVMPLYRTDQRLAVAIEDPLNWRAVRELEFVSGLKVDPVLASGADILTAIAEYYGDGAGSERIGQLVDRLGQESAALPVDTGQPVITESDNTLVRLVNKMIVDAFDQGASDIHVESRSASRPSRVRFRIDGELRPYVEIPANFRLALVSRLKIMCELDIAEHRRPQDGIIRFQDFGPRRLELRVLVMPTANGLEDVVLRLLAPPRTLVLEQLGLAPRELAQLRALVGRTYGLLLVCGPTGSGKTTTLHSLLAHVNTPRRKIWTVEDPVEISQDGLCQVQVNHKLGLTFPAVLRSFLRGDPDVIMVGETRDEDTARTVVSASLTGHLVLTTMHTNSAAESVVRLLDFGLDAYNFSDALLAVLGQRLARRLCSCKRPRSAAPQEIEVLAQQHARIGGAAAAELVARWRSRYGDADGRLTLYQAVGCSACGGTGYKGRLGIYELLLVTPEIKQAIQARAPAGEILQRALAAGMTTLEQDGIEKILQGQLDHEQLMASCR